MSEAIGIMDSAYFVPRQELLRWVNQMLNLRLQRIEDLGSGAVYCQLLDIAFGQLIPMNKVNWKAKFQYQFISNLKIFQDGLQKLMISRKVDIEKLSRAKYQDNLELIQWLKRYIEIHGSFNPNYDPLERRHHAELLETTKIKKALQNSNKKNTFYNCELPTPRGKQNVPKKLLGSVTKANNKTEKLKLAEIKDILFASLNPLQKLSSIEEIVLGKKSNHISEQEQEVF